MDNDIKTCCDEPVVKTTNQLFVNAGKLYSTVNGEISVVDLSDISGSSTSIIERNINPLSDGQVIFLNAFPNDETFVSLTIGIPMVLDEDYEISNNNIIWTGDVSLETSDVLTIITTKNIQ